MIRKRRNFKPFFDNPTSKSCHCKICNVRIFKNYKGEHLYGHLTVPQIDKFCNGNLTLLEVNHD